MQALVWILRRRHQQWRACQGEWFLQDMSKKKNCVKAHNKTCIRARLLHLLQTQGEEKAFLIEHLLPPNQYLFSFTLKIGATCILHIYSTQPRLPFFFFTLKQLASLWGNLGGIIYFFE